MSITADGLREILDYEPSTGVFRWRVQCSHGTRAGDVAGGVKNHGYVVIGIQGKRYYAHRLAWLHVHGSWPVEQIDHINGIRGDNRIHNLRCASTFVNQQNRRLASRRNKSSGLLGAYPHGKRWMSKIMANKVLHKLGTFDTAQEAHEAYRAAKSRLHPGCSQ